MKEETREEEKIRDERTRPDEEEETGQKMEDKRRSERRLEEKRSKTIVFFLKITGPSNNFEFSKLPLPTLKAFFDFSR